MKLSFAITVLCLLVLAGAKAQQLKFSGLITDSLKQGIANTNVIARPLINEAKFQFDISDINGAYNLKLQAKIL
ncbi:hypothetical protein [Psychroflexus sp. ALD_RP9]|uniref:hypothetical protein n=1 Tax=Psychroflexus sp. ALD_RP9 TaxID=2777186 RepID=UPI001A8C28C1|nr:hypothetical protein [Psychroflexus sp. ALD_RP9]QSS97133.1 hypothetical protein IMZ30_11950 [Psychroflexus sp. ALD_RP9]